MKLEIGGLYICDRHMYRLLWKDKVCLYLGEEKTEFKLPISSRSGATRTQTITYYIFLKEGKIVKTSETFIKYMRKVSE
jgi:hypothetical protein